MMFNLRKHMTSCFTAKILRIFSCALLILTYSWSAFAIELEPRLWSHLPVNKNFGGIGYVYTEADIFLDPATQLEDVEMELQTIAAKYIRTFALFNKTARIDLTQAYQEGRWEGLLAGNFASTERSGLSDSLVRLAVNLYGSPPLKGKEFQSYRAEHTSETTVGFGLVARLPTGQYYKDKLINLGKNRYALRPQLGMQHSQGKWSAEITGEVAFYTKNDEFFGDTELEQEPLYIAHGHLIYTHTPGFWLGASIGYDYGGENTVDGVEKDNKKQDIGWALSAAYPINRVSGLKLTYINTRTQEDTGFDSDSLAISASYLW
jgi:hypothetical protein